MSAPRPVVSARSRCAESGHPNRAAFTLIEMLTTVAILIIVMGLMISLARSVRDTSARQLTQKLLQELDVLMAQYADHNGGRLPRVEPLLPANASADKVKEDQALREIARRNNEQCIRALRADYASHRTDPALPVDPFAQEPISIYDSDPLTHLASLRDAWGSPIIFMAGQHPLIGMAASRERQDQPFFFSAGPDRKYLTRDDNLYSYETANPAR